jgi:hypothetical protein
MSIMRSLSRRAYWALRWFACQFLWIGGRSGSPAVLASLSRLAGLAVMIGLIWFTLTQSWQNDEELGFPVYLLTALVGVLFGNLAKECAISFCAGVLGWFDCDFSHRGATLDGKKYWEYFFSDGTWMRCESGPQGNVCEWTDRYGACNRVETSPVRAQGSPEA